MHIFDCLGELLCQWRQNTMFLRSGHFTNYTAHRIPQQLEVCRSAVRLVYTELLYWTDSLSDLQLKEKYDQVEGVRPQTHHPHQRSSRSEMREWGHSSGTYSNIQEWGQTFSEAWELIIDVLALFAWKLLNKLYFFDTCHIWNTFSLWGHLFKDARVTAFDLRLEAGWVAWFEVWDLRSVLADVTRHLSACRPGAQTQEISLSVCPALKRRKRS